MIKIKVDLYDTKTETLFIFSCSVAKNNGIGLRYQIYLM